jgi:hypothetical protein
MIYLFSRRINIPPPPIVPLEVSPDMSTVTALGRRKRDRAKPMLSTIQFSSNSSSVVAGNLATFTLTRSGIIGLPCQVQLVLTNVTTNASDYISLSSTLVTFEPGDPSSKTITLQTVADSDSTNETATITIIPVLNATVGTNSVHTVTITPAVTYGALTTALISRLSAKGITRSSAVLNAHDTLFNDLISGGFITATRESTDKLSDMLSFLISPTGLATGDAQKIAETKLLTSVGSDFEAPFQGVNNSNFSLSLGLSGTAGVNGSKFNTKVPINLGKTTADSRSLVVHKTGDPTATFAAFLHGKNSASPSEFGLRVHSATTNSTGGVAKAGAINATSIIGGTNEKCIGFTIRAATARTMRLMVDGAEVGTTAGETAHDPGSATIWGNCYSENSVAGDAYDNKFSIAAIFRVGLTATEHGNVSTIFKNFVTNMRAT